MKKLLLLLILSLFSTSGFSASCPDGSEPTRSVSADGTYYVYKCDNNSNDDQKINKSSENRPMSPNAYFTSTGWRCKTGYYRNNNKCPRLPSNAYAHSEADGFSCKSGYTISGNSCIANIYIPPNAYATGSGWKCHGGFTQSGNSCIASIYISPNAYETSTGWRCKTGYYRNYIFNRCDRLPSNAYAHSQGDGFSCKSGYTKSGYNCIKKSEKVFDDDEVYSAASGSGFAVTSDGYVITNYHVIEGCTDVKIHDKGKSILATLVTFDPLNDIALLKGNFKPRSYYPLSRKSPKLLMDVYVAGHPFGQAISTSVKVTKGIVSSLSGIANNFSNLQIDAALQPGNSGGPIMNDKGNVIGVAVAKLDFATILDEFDTIPENVNFGVKANVVINILESENIKLPSPNADTIPKSELVEMITDGTYYLSCWMTMAQIETMKETKVMFSNLK